MKMSDGSRFRISEAAVPSDPNPIASAAGIHFADRLAGAVQCSVDVAACMVSVGVFVMILILRFAGIFFIALLAMLFGRR